MATPNHLNDVKHNTQMTQSSAFRVQFYPIHGRNMDMLVICTWSCYAQARVMHMIVLCASSCYAHDRLIHTSFAELFSCFHEITSLGFFYICWIIAIRYLAHEHNRYVTVQYYVLIYNTYRVVFNDDMQYDMKDERITIFIGCG